MTLRRIGLGAMCSIVLALFPSIARGLTDEEVFRDFRFNFINPGARSLGLGGAFIAAADDATAVQANPAALHYVSKSEAFLEYRAVRPETQVFTPSQPIGSLSDPTPFFLDLTSVNNRERTTIPSFASFAYPFRVGSRRATFAVSRQVVLDVENTLESDNGADTTNLRFSLSEYPLWVNTGLSCATSEIVERYSICNTVEGGLKTELVRYNVGVSYSFADDFSLGLTATMATLDMDSEVINRSEDPRGVLSSSHPRADAGGGLLAPIVTRTAISDSDSAIAYTVGLHWHPDKAFPGGISPLRLGLVYRRGAELGVSETSSTLVSGAFVQDSVFENTLREPDRVGIGMSYELKHRWTFALDAERIEFSDLLENYRSGLNLLTSSSITTASVNFNFTNPVFDVDDATVLHAGVEFFSRTRAGWGYMVRGGYYNAPDNRIRLTEVSVSGSNAAAIEGLLRDTFRGGEEVDHFTAGFSLNTPAGLHMQFAGDFADTGNEFLASAIYRFGKGR